MDLLLHMCCAPCTTYSAGRFNNLGFSVHGYFFNPNIHPCAEFKKRMQELKNYCQLEGIPLATSEDYQPEQYHAAICGSSDGRCFNCYSIRLNEAARMAKDMGFANYATTLAISPYQDHDLLRQAGETAAARFGVNFVYHDLRPGYRESIEISRRLGLYRQSYCGCVYSEKERQLAKKRRKKND